MSESIEKILAAKLSAEVDAAVARVQTAADAWVAAFRAQAERLVADPASYQHLLVPPPPPDSPPPAPPARSVIPQAGTAPAITVSEGTKIVTAAPAAPIADAGAADAAAQEREQALAGMTQYQVTDSGAASSNMAPLHQQLSVRAVPQTAE